MAEKIRVRETQLREGMVVHSMDGAKLGKIISCSPDGFIVQKGIFFPKTETFLYEQVGRERNQQRSSGPSIHNQPSMTDQSAPESRWGGLQTSAAGAGGGPREEARPLREDARERTENEASSARTGLGEKLRAKMDEGKERLQEKKESLETKRDERARATAPSAAASDPDEIRVPLAEEEITTEKRLRDSGEVRIHKHVVVTQKQITVPVMREEVRVEHVPYDPSSAPAATEGTFVESTVRIPLHEEHVEIHKRPVVREEVLVRKHALSEDRTSTAEARREEIDIQGPAPDPQLRPHR